MIKKITLFIICLFSTANIFAQATWSGGVANIIYTNCSKCHNSNGIAPFALMSYFDAVDNASNIKADVQIHKMPPWPPNSAYSHLSHERVLTAQQISDIANWVDNGMPRGDSLVEPTAPVFSSSNEIASPNLTLQIPTYNVNTMSGDIYRCFVLPTGLSALRYMTGLETVPGDRSIVHHVLIYSDSSTTPLMLDANDPGPGYTNFGGTGSNSSKLIGIWVPGQGAYFTPASMGIKLPANSYIILQVHYPAGITGKTDSTKINLQLTSQFRREIAIEAALNHYQLDQGWLTIPANQTRTYTAHYTIPYDLSVLAVGPHMHLIGKSIRAWGITPTSDTIPFIDIPQWDFHWQGVYSFPRVMKLPAGTVIHSTAFYDNTINNPENPSSPPINVTLGESTTDEMMLVYFAYTLYFPGDENIIIDSTIVTALPATAQAIVQTVQLYDAAPNPANDHVSIQYFIPTSGSYTLDLIGTNGRLIQSVENKLTAVPGFYTSGIDVSKLSAGIYYLRLQSEGIVRTKKTVVNHN